MNRIPGYLPIWALFCLNGLLLGAWFTRVPSFQEKWHLSPAQLSVALLAVVAGNVAALPVIHAALAKLGPRPVAGASIALMGLSLPLAMLTPSWLLSLALLFVFGAAFSGVDLPMNAAAAWLEGQVKRPLMSTLHAAYSIGAFLAALIGGLAISSLSAAAHLGLTGAVCAALGVAFAFRLPARIPDSPDEHTQPVPGRRTALAAPVRGLMFLAFAAALCEGAVGDWSGLFMTEVGRLSAGASTTGLMVFSLAMIAGRLGGDHMRASTGNASAALLGAGLMVSGFALAIYFPGPVSALSGFTAAGLGLSLLAPLIFSASGEYGSRAIAGVTAAFYAGFLAGPALIGLVAEVTGLRWAFGVPLILGLIFMHRSGTDTLLKRRHTITRPEPADRAADPS